MNSKVKDVLTTGEGREDLQRGAADGQQVVRFRRAARVSHPRQQGPPHPRQPADPIHEATRHCRSTA